MEHSLLLVKASHNPGSNAKMHDILMHFLTVQRAAGLRYIS
jgi:hypothetical protein